MKLEEIEKLCQEATSGPWEAQIPAMTGEWPKARIWPLKIEGKLYHYAMIKTADAEFIAASRTLMPKLLAVAKAAIEIHDRANPDFDDVIALKHALEELERE